MARMVSMMTKLPQSPVAPEIRAATIRMAINGSISRLPILERSLRLVGSTATFRPISASRRAASRLDTPRIPDPSRPKHSSTGRDHKPSRLPTGVGTPSRCDVGLGMGFGAGHPAFMSRCRTPILCPSHRIGYAAESLGSPWAYPVQWTSLRAGTRRHDAQKFLSRPSLRESRHR